ncbi:MAG: regulatory protein RecX [Clostridia bacterium]
MIITSVKPIKKSLNQLYIDGEPAVQIDKEVFLLSPYKQGDEISDEELFCLLEQSNFKRAKERALYYLERRNFCKKDLINKLYPAFSKETAQEVAEHMEKIGLINDLEYGKMYARDMVNLKKYGKIRVKSELYRKGLDKFIIEGILDELWEEEDNSAQNIISILERRYPNFNEDEKTKRRAIAALQRKGYSYSQIKMAIKDLEYYE